MSTDNDTWSTDSATEEPAIGPWLEFDVQPFIDDYGWLQWTAINAGDAPAPIDTPVGHYSVNGQDRVEVITLFEELGAGARTGEIAANLLELTPEDGEYAVRCALGSFNFEVRYVVESGAVRKP
jgi:uncharacterized protein (DUF433 family)